MEITPTTLISSPPTTIPTTVITRTPTTQIHETENLKSCKNKRCLTCNEESDEEELCLSCDESIYKKVNYTKKYSKFFDCIKEKELEHKYYKDILTDQYKPCFQLCKRCLGPGNVTNHNCLECEKNYMFRPGDNPYNNCVVYSEYYYMSAYNEYRPLNIPQYPEEAKFMIKHENNSIFCIYDCKEIFI